VDKERDSPVAHYKRAPARSGPALQDRSTPTLKHVERGIVCALFVIGFGLALFVAPQWVSTPDDGLYMYQANVIMRGGVPYRDFLLHDGPLGSAWHALLLTIFGNDVLVLRLAVLPFKAALLPAIYLLARPLVPRVPALLASLIVPITDSSTRYTVAHVAINALSLGVIVVVLLAAWRRRPHPAWLVSAGFLLAIITGFKQNMGLYLFAGAALWLLDPDHVMPVWKRSGLGDNPQPRGGNWLRIIAWGAAVLNVVWLTRAQLAGTVLVGLGVPVLAR